MGVMDWIKISPGAVFKLPGHAVWDGAEPLEGKTRFVIVVSSRRVCQDAAIPVVSCCFLSTSTDWNSEYCQFLPADLQAGNPEDCWVRVPSMQPIKKDRLTQSAWVGDAPADLVNEIVAAIVDYLGALD